MLLVIYADVLVVVNLYVDFFLLWCVDRFLGLRAKALRLLAGALVGALAALLSLPPGQPGWLTFLLGAATAAAASLAAFAPRERKLLAKAALCLWVFSFLLAGCCLFFLRVFAPGNMAVVGSAIYLDLSLPLLFFLTCGAYGVLWLCQRVLPPGPARQEGCRFTVTHQGRSLELFAKADTGSALREPFSGLPVIVCQKEALQAVAPAAVLAYCPEDPAPQPVPGLRLVPFTSLGGVGVLPAFRPDQVTASLTGQPVDCYLALFPRPLSAGGFNALYNPRLFPQGAGLV